MSYIDVKVGPTISSALLFWLPPIHLADEGFPTLNRIR